MWLAKNVMIHRNIPLHMTSLSSVDAHWGTKIAGVPGYAFFERHVRESQHLRIVINVYLK